eukprot:7185846-Prorocentrum_lima.AAC.1
MIKEATILLAKRYVTAGKRLKNLVFTGGGCVLWKSSGVYTVSEDRNTIHHVCGGTAALPKGM